KDAAARQRERDGGHSDDDDGERPPGDSLASKAHQEKSDGRAHGEVHELGEVAVVDERPAVGGDAGADVPVDAGGAGEVLREGYECDDRADDRDPSEET